MKCAIKNLRRGVRLENYEHMMDRKNGATDNIFIFGEVSTQESAPKNIDSCEDAF